METIGLTNLKLFMYLSLEVIVQTRVGGLPPISKHREELKIRSEAEYILTNFEVF